MYARTMTLMLAILMVCTSSMANEIDEKRYAILIGIDQYQGDYWKPLQTSNNDINNIGDILKKKYNFNEVTLLSDQNATKETILSSIEKLIDQTDANDNLVIYFSGHSAKIDSKGYWVPSDATQNDVTQLVSHQAIQNLIQKAASRHILVIADGYLDENIFKNTNLSFQNDGSLNYYAKVKSRISRQAISSGAERPVKDLNDRNSVMGKYVAKYLDENDKDLLDAAELFEMISYPLNANGDLNPSFGYIQNTEHEGGQFIFQINKKQSCNLFVSVEEGNQVLFNKYGTLHAKASQTDGVSYQWTLNGDLIGRTRILDVLESGEYEVKATTITGCSESAVIEVMVEKVPLQVRIAEETYVEFKNTGVLHAQCNQTADIDYEWRKDNRVIGRKPYLRVYESGLYTVQAYADNGRIAGSKVTGVKIIKDERKYNISAQVSLLDIAKQFYDNEDKWLLIYDANKDYFQTNKTPQPGTDIIIPDDRDIDFSTIEALKIVTGDDLPPFVDNDYYKNGLMSDMVEDIFNEMKQDVVLDQMSWEHAKNAVSVITYAATFPYIKTDQHEEEYLLSEPLAEMDVVWFKRSDSKIDNEFLETSDTLNHIILAQVEGYEFNNLEKYMEKGLQVKYYESFDLCFKQLYRGHADLVVIGEESGINIINSIEYMELNDFSVLNEGLGIQTIHLMMSKEYPDAEAIMYKFNKKFETLKKEGKIDSILKLHYDLIGRMYD